VNGNSAAHLPNQVSKKNTLTKDQNIKRVIGLNCIPVNTKLLELIGNKKRTNTAISIATTPPNLLGIERRIA